MQIRMGTFATYQGEEYEAREVWDVLDEDKVKLILRNTKHAPAGFSPSPTAEDVWTKTVLMSELDSYYSIDTYATYKGHKFYLQQNRNGELVLGHSGMDYTIPEAFGFTFIEPGVFEKKVQFEELDRVWEEKRKITE